MFQFLKSYFNKYSSKGVKNFLILSIGTTFSQAIPFLVSPLLTRYFSPENFGILEIVLRINGLLSVFFCLRLDQAIVVSKSPKLGAEISGSSFFISIFSLFFSTLFLLLASNQIIEFFGEPAVSDWLLFIPILSFLTGAFNISFFFLLKRSSYKSLGGLKTADSLINNLSKVGFGFITPNQNFGLIFPNFLGVGISAFISSILAFRGYWDDLIAGFKLKNVKKYLKEFKDFPLLNMPNALIDALQISIFIILITKYFGTTNLGLYAITIRVLKTPLGIIGNSINQMFLQQASEKINGGQSIISLFKNNLLFLGGVGVLVFLPILIFGPQIFSFVFGANWADSGRLAQITGVWLLLGFLVSGLSNLPVVLRKQAGVLKFALFNFFLQNGSLIICTQFNLSFFESIGVVATVECIYFVVVLIWYSSIVYRKNVK